MWIKICSRLEKELIKIQSNYEFTLTSQHFENTRSLLFFLIEWNYYYYYWHYYNWSSVGMGVVP